MFFAAIRIGCSDSRIKVITKRFTGVHFYEPIS